MYEHIQILGDKLKYSETEIAELKEVKNMREK